MQSQRGRHHQSLVDHAMVEGYTGQQDSAVSFISQQLLMAISSNHFHLLDCYAMLNRNLLCNYSCPRRGNFSANVKAEIQQLPQRNSALPYHLWTMTSCHALLSGNDYFCDRGNDGLVVEDGPMHVLFKSDVGWWGMRSYHQLLPVQHPSIVLQDSSPGHKWPDRVEDMWQ
jgi:hypothetical protein